MTAESEQTLPPQHQDRQPGVQSEMRPQPASGEHTYLAAGKLKGRAAIITGGDSGIGRAVAVAFAKEGADVLVCYLDEHDDAQETRRLVEAEGRRCGLLAGDVGSEVHCDAIVSFTRSLAKSLAERGIRVNGVAPGPIWTPLIPASFSAEEVAKFGADTPLKRPGQPEEVAPCYVFLASSDSSYMTGQVLHPNGGEVVNG